MILPLYWTPVGPTPQNLKLMSALILVLELAHKSVIKMDKKFLTALRVVFAQTGV